NGFVSNYAVAPGNLCDQQQWTPALQAHVELFGQAPRLATADRGFWNSANEKAAAQLGVKKVVLPACGRLLLRNHTGGSHRSEVETKLVGLTLKVAKGSFFEEFFIGSLSCF